MLVVLPPFIAHFATLAGDYDVALCDVWGVVHNGVVAAPEACDALTRFRERGGTVVLITNAPRPGERVARGILDHLGSPRRWRRWSVLITWSAPGSSTIRSRPRGTTRNSSRGCARVPCR